MNLNKKLWIINILIRWQTQLKTLSRYLSHLEQMQPSTWFVAIDLAKAIVSVLISRDHQKQFAFIWQGSGTPSLYHL